MMRGGGRPDYRFQKYDRYFDEDKQDNTQLAVIDRMYNPNSDLTMLTRIHPHQVLRHVWMPVLRACLAIDYTDPDQADTYLPGIFIEELNKTMIALNGDGRFEMLTIAKGSAVGDPQPIAQG